MQAFICAYRPRSINAKHTDRFQEQIRQAFATYCTIEQLFDIPLYGIVYYFHKRSNQLDADNLSKPIWDALEGVAYQDDRIIQLRHAGIIDLQKIDLAVLDLSNIPDAVANDIIALAGNRDHILYVEFGPLASEMFTFGHDR